MSLSSSIEFESRHYRSHGSADTDAVFLQTQPPPRVRYPTPDYDREETVETTHHERIVVITKKSVPDENSTPYTSDHRSPQRSSLPLTPPVEYRVSASSTATGTTHSTVPFSIRSSLSVGEANSTVAAIEEEELKEEHGASAAINGDEKSDEEHEDDGFVVVTEQSITNDERQPDRFGFLGGSVQ